MELSEDLKGLIYRNIMQAKDKLKQVTIEAECNAIPVRAVRGILKERGVDLRILNGANLNKPKEEQSEDNNTDWDDMAIPPVEAPAEQAGGILTDVQDIPEAESLLSAGESPKVIKDLSEDDAFIIDTHIIKVDDIFDAIGEKVHTLFDKRRSLLAEVEEIDTYLRRYEYFFTDLSELIESEGVEV